jgi:hypothetical protein
MISFSGAWCAAFLRSASSVEGESGSGVDRLHNLSFSLAYRLCADDSSKQNSSAARLLHSRFASCVSYNVALTKRSFYRVAGEEPFVNLMPKHPHLGEFMRRMEPHSIAIIPSAREAVRSHDTNYRYRQSSDFYYLTGFDEPEAIAVVRPGYAEGAYTLFVRPRDVEKEAWDGARAGVEGAKDVHGADAAFPVAEFNQKLGDLLGGTGNLYYRLGYDRDLDDQLIRKLSEMRGLTRRGRRCARNYY